MSGSFPYKMPPVGSLVFLLHAHESVPLALLVCFADHSFATHARKTNATFGVACFLLHGYIIALMNFYASISFIFNFYAFCSVFYAMFFYIICIFLLAIKIKLLYSKGKFKKDST
ncbi:MAG: hypothetical protein EGR90_06585 [Lachnospiraceae bacterium]|nr:hypothetical protein [Lachnospiraceae bacterium]